ncbi:transglycosylase SLT domain-containing protein [Limnobacter humi]|uniref:Transglycosylase SLT domain-containing protein n=1 Tax=Limnobacter humi TaxID=1778671 RepID=A0ABT1WFJ6_9BURK|nr:transglycosylase SLT domain-containing protein [Limnobacter humi]MCQ8896292.1 transglycosylase SLT domain-containing protein [Limnobacter humi]
MNSTLFKKRSFALTAAPLGAQGGWCALRLALGWVLLGLLIAKPGYAAPPRDELSLNSNNDGQLFGLVSPNLSSVNAMPSIQLKLVPPPVPVTVDLSVPADDVWTELKRGFTIPDIDNAEVRDREAVLLRSTRMVNGMLVRSKPYLYFIARECEKRGLPTELALIPFIESQFNPNARSPSAAEGLWQFIPSTGRQFDLKQNRYVDERRDLIASTRAALDYLTYLYDMHGDWHLALMSYNWGEGAVLRAVKRTREMGQEPIWSNLDVPAETRQYLPKLQALKNLILNPERFNVVLPEVPNTPYFTEIKKPGNLDLREIARLAQIDLESIQKLNTALNQPVLYAAQTDTLLVPIYHEDKVKETLVNYQSPRHFSSPTDRPGRTATKTEYKPSSPKSYQIRRGDTLAELATQFRVSVDDLLKANKLSKRSVLRPGTSIRIPAGEAPSGKRRHH